MPPPFTQAEVLKFFGLVVIVVAIVFGISTVKDWYAASQTLKGVEQDAIATSGIIGDDTKNEKDRGAQDAAVTSGQQAYQSSYQGAMQNEPEVATRAERRVPDGVRESFRKRRLARERFGCAGEQCQPRSEAEAADER